MIDLNNPILSTFITLSIAVLGIGLILYFVKKYTDQHRINDNAYGMKILSKLSLSPKNHIYAIEAGGKKLLIGVSDKSINTLAELENNTNIRKEIAKYSNKESQIPKTKIDNPDLSFSSFIRSAFKRN